jgi:hypothetical protein
MSPQKEEAQERELLGFNTDLNVCHSTSQANAVQGFDWTLTAPASSASVVSFKAPPPPPLPVATLMIDGHEVLPNQQVDVFPAPAAPGFYGCSEAGWSVMAQLVGTEYLLPTVCNPYLWNARGWRTADTGEQVRVLGGGSFGKTPSAVNTSGRLHGIQGWQLKVPTDWELKQWAQNRDLGILIRTNKARALDIDCNNPETVAAILDVVARHFGPDRWSHTPIRWRDNSARKTLLFIVEEPVSKQVVALRPELRDPNAKKGEAYELLGDGQQTLWGGTHPSGARLQHSQLNAARGLPVVTLAELELLWSELANKFAQDVVKAATLEKGHGAALVLASNRDDPVAQYLFEQGHARGSDRGKVHVDCPWQEHHESSAGTTPVGSASWLLAGVDAEGKTMHGRFNCKHTGCKAHGSGRLVGETNDRGLTERFLDAIGYRDAQIAADFPAMPAPSLEQFTAIPHPEGNVIPFPGPPGGEPSAGPAPNKFTATSKKAFLAKPPASFMMENVLPYQGVACVVGASGVGKTFLVLDMILNLLSGSETWFGNKIYDRPKGVMYLVLEDDAGVRGRVTAWEQHHGTDVENLVFLDEQQVNLSQTEDVDCLIRLVLETIGKGAMVVIDTQAMAAVGLDEQSAKDMGVFYNNLHKISRAIEGIVMPIAHTGKDPSLGIRGSSAQFAACDVVISVKQQGGVGSWFIDKSKLDIGGHPGHFTLARTVIGVHPTTGAEIPSGYVVPQNEPAPVKAVTNKDGKVVCAALATLLEASGGQPVSRDALKDEVYKRMDAAVPPVTKDSRRTLLQRGIKDALECKAIEQVHGDRFKFGYAITGIALPPPDPFGAGREGDSS